MDVKDQVKRNVSISDVVSMYVDLKPAGKYLKALCPFHTEKTPSFFVMPDKDTFTCYGCNKFGDIFSFIQEIENLNFRETLFFLIDKFNIPIDSDQYHKKNKKDDFSRINEIALAYFKYNLIDTPEGKKAQLYLKERGITQETLQRFSLGYAINCWDGLYNFLRKKSVDIEKAIQLGLLIKNQNHKIYDRFRGRIIFPIYTESNDQYPIAFGGRTIFDDPNKYLNSPDTPLYKKSKHLYGFFQAKDAIRKNKKVILVEGYFDVVSMFQSGVEYAVASLGTALTENQVNLMARFSENDNIYLFYDNDTAGIEATIRAIEKMFEQNINPKIVSPQEKNIKDPDDFIRAKGLKAFNQLLMNSDDAFKYLIDYYTQKFDINVPEKKFAAIENMMAIIEKISESIIRNDYIRKIADFFGVDEQTIHLKMKRQSTISTDKKKIKRLAITLAEQIFLEDILAMPEFISEIKELLNEELFSVLASRNILYLILKNFNSDSKEIQNFNNLLKELSDSEKSELRVAFEKSKISQKNKEQIAKEIEDCIKNFYDRLNKRETKRLNQEIKMAAKEQNIEKVTMLLEKKNKYYKAKYFKKNEVSNIRQGAVD